MRKQLRNCVLLLVLAVLAYRCFAATTTSTFSINSSTYVTVTANADCRWVQIMEDNQAGTTDFLVKGPATGNTPITIPGGKIFTISGPFRNGDTVIFVKGSTGSATFDQVTSN